MTRLIVIVAFILFALAIFALVWWLTNRVRRRPTPRRRPVAPDDNPEFLRSIQIPDPPADDEDDRG